MRANNNGRVQIVFSEKIVLEDYENLVEAIQESGALQLQLISQVENKQRKATDFTWTISNELKLQNRPDFRNKKVEKMSIEL